MDETRFNSFLKELGISENKTWRERKELLSLRMAEFQDSPMYQEDGADERQELFDQAIDYAEKMQSEQESGLTIDDGTQAVGNASNGNVIDLKNRSASNDPASPVNVGNTSSAVSAKSSGNQASWFYSLKGAENINNLFVQAKDCLHYGEYEKADRIADSIIDLEPRNASAFLVKVLAKNQTENLSGLETINDPKFKSDVNITKLLDFSDDSQRVEVTNILDRNDKFLVYVKAERQYRDALNNEDPVGIKDAGDLFESINDYRDASKKASECKEKSAEIEEKLRIEKEEADKKAAEMEAERARLEAERLEQEHSKAYNYAVGSLIGYKDSTDIKALPYVEKALEEFKALGNYEDSEEYVRKCEAQLEAIHRASAAKYNRDKFLSRIICIPVILIMLVLGFGFGDFTEFCDYTLASVDLFYDSELVVETIPKFISRFLPLAATKSRVEGRVYFGFGTLEYDSTEVGLPLIAPFAKLEGNVEDK